MITIRCTSDKNKTADVSYTLLVGKPYQIGRKGGDISFPDDQSVSRNHAEITVDHPSPNMSDPLLIPTVVLTDLGSKFGTFTNEGINRRVKLSMREPVNLSPGDKFRFGLQWNEYEIEYTPLVVTTSTIKDPMQLKNIIMTLGGHMVNEWCDKCDYVVMDVLTLTVKAVSAILSAKHIVTPSFFHDLHECVLTKKGRPNPMNFLPPFGEKTLDADGLSLRPDVRRTQLFEGKTFLFANQKHLKKLAVAIKCGGGVAALITTASRSDLQRNDFIIVKPMHDYSMLDSEVQKRLDIYKDSNKRLIQDSEIGLAAVYISVEIHCNPRANFPENSLIKLGSQTQASGSKQNSGRHVMSEVPETQDVPTQVSVPSQSNVVEYVEDSEPIRVVKQEASSEVTADPVASISGSKSAKRNLMENEDNPRKKRSADDSLARNVSDNKRLRSGVPVESEKFLSSMFGLSDSDSEEDNGAETSDSLPEFLDRVSPVNVIPASLDVVPDSLDVVPESLDVVPDSLDIVPDSPDAPDSPENVNKSGKPEADNFRVPAVPERRATRSRGISETPERPEVVVEPSSNKRKTRTSDDESAGRARQTLKKRRTKTENTSAVVSENDDLADQTEQLTIEPIKTENMVDKIHACNVPIVIRSLLKKPTAQPKVEVVNGINVKNFKTFKKVLPLAQQRNNNGGSGRRSGSTLSGLKLTFEVCDYSPGGTVSNSFGPSSPQRGILRSSVDDFEDLPSASTARSEPRPNLRNGRKKVETSRANQPDLFQTRSSNVPPVFSSAFEEDQDEENQEEDIWGFN